MTERYTEKELEELRGEYEIIAPRLLATVDALDREVVQYRGEMLRRQAERDAAEAERDRLREALVRIAGTPTKNSSEEAREMARAANATVEGGGI